MPIPWLQLVKLAPTIVSLTNDLRQQSRKAQGSTAAPLAGQLQEVEDNLHRQAQALHGLAEQMQTMTTILAALRRGVRAAVVLAGAALLMSVAALVLIFFR